MLERIQRLSTLPLALWCGLLGCAAATGGGTAGSGSGGSGGAGAGGDAPLATTTTGSGGEGTLGAGGGSGSACAVAAMQEAGAICKIPVTIDSFMISSQTCFVDSPLVAGDPGELTFACGDGPAELAFPSGVFVGSSTSCDLDLKLTTQFDFVDGCTWQSSQSISGPMEGQLTYHYSEMPIVGSGCASPCTVDATLSMEQSGEVQVEPPK